MISIILATKNGSLYIEKAIDSILTQTYSEFEIIVISDGSTDNTIDIVKNIQINEPRIKLYELKENIGPGRARNLAILGGTIQGVTVSPSLGEYISIIDDDDLWLSKEKLFNQKEYLDNNKDIVVVGSSRVAFVNERNGHTWWLKNSEDPDHIRKSMLGYNPIITSSVMFRKSAYIACGGFSPAYLAEDYDLWLSMGKLGKISNISGCDTQYTIRNGSASKSRQMEMNKAVLALAIKYRKDYPNFLYAFIKGCARIVLLYIKNFLK
jgi:glycosyltransferase involved in cell wall biosynthesis